VVDLWREKPEMFAINARVKHKTYLDSEVGHKGS